MNYLGRLPFTFVIRLGCTTYLYYLQDIKITIVISHGLSCTYEIILIERERQHVRKLRFPCPIDNARLTVNQIRTNKIRARYDKTTVWNLTVKVCVIKGN